MSNNDYVVQLTKKLVGFNTSNPPGNELILAEYLSDVLDEIGFKCEIQPVGENRANLIARFGKKNGGKKLLLNGHLDVVPPGKGWSYNPFGGEIADGRVYGRGTCDMKGAIAAMISAVKKVIRTNIDLNGEIIVFLCADEEANNLGAKEFMKSSNEAIDFAIIGEPTGLDICTAHRGVVRHNLTFHGKACHSSDPSKGVNAITWMSKFVLAFNEFQEKVEKETHSLLPPTSTAITMVEGGEKDNIIPDTCKISIDRRLVPGQTVESVEKQIKEVLDRIFDENSKATYTLERYIYLPAGELSLDSQLLTISKETFKEVFNQEANVLPFPATCEQSLFIEKNIQAIICGPGSINQAHTIDEFIEIDELIKASDYYETLIKKILA